MGPSASEVMPFVLTVTGREDEPRSNASPDEVRGDDGLRRLAAIVQCSKDAIVVTDPDGVVTDWNPAAERLHGWTAAEIVGRPVSVLTPAHLVDEARAVSARVLAGELVEDFETERLCRDGTTVHVSATIAPLHAENGELIGVSAISRDITERKRAERDLARHTEHLQALSARDALIVPPERESEVMPARRDRDLVQSVLRLVREHMGMDVAWLAEFTGGQMVFRALEGERDFFGLEEGAGIDLEGTYCQRMVDGRIGNIVADAAAHPEVRMLDVTADARMGAYIGVPVHHAGGRLYGTLCCSSHEPDPTLAERDARFMHVLAGLLAEQLDRQALEADNRRLHGEVTAISALLAALDARDHYTGEHSRTVVELSRAVAKRLGVSAVAVAEVEQVALLHDLGKVGIPDAVLQKPGPLNDAEWALMREHPAIGARIVAAIDSLAHLAPAVRAEHERWDGAGYPDGLTGEAIPIASRITLACDAYHAMTSDRPYRAAIPLHAAHAELRAHAGRQFDPDVVDALLSVLSDTR